jgi:hypothetical protein
VDGVKLILSADPGAPTINEVLDKAKKNNLARQIVSTHAGLKACSRKYAVKLRTDADLFGDGLYEFVAREEGFADPLGLGIQQQIVIDRVCSLSFSQTGWLFHFSDIWMAGLTSDLLKIWSLSPPSEPDFTNFFRNRRTPRRMSIFLPNVNWAQLGCY